MPDKKSTHFISSIERHHNEESIIAIIGLGYVDFLFLIN